MPASTLSRDILLAALAGFQLDKQRIEGQIAEVQAMLNGSGSSEPEPSVPNGTPKKRSAAVRKRMAEAQRAKWAKIKGESEPAAPEAPKAKRQISPEGMKRIIAATKKRWRLKRAQAGTAATPKSVKKAAPAKAAKKAAPKKAAVKKAAPAPAALVKSAGQ
jgi:adenylate kinase